MKALQIVFLVSTWLVLCQANFLENSETELKSVFDRISGQMLSALNTATGSRPKRDLSSTGVSLIDDSGVYRLTSIKPVAELCSPAIRTTFLDVSNETYAICVSEMTASDPAEVVMGHYREHTWVPKHRWMVNDPMAVAAFSWKWYIYVLVAELDNADGIKVVKINLQTEEVKAIYTARNSHPTSLAVWKRGNTYNMAVASSFGFKGSQDLSSHVLIYVWKDTYFDIYAEIPSYYVTDLEPFQIGDFSYLAIANFRKGSNLPDVDSEILRFDVDDNSWKSFQKIRLAAAMDWEFFTLGTDFGQEFFLAVANQGNGDSMEKSMIYKFVGDRFQPFQCLSTTKATSISSYSEDSKFVLAIANADDSVHLYQYDGWSFVQSIQFSKGAMSSGVVHLDFHRVMRNSQSAVILSVSNPQHPKYQSVFEMGFFLVNPLKEWHEKSTEWCFNVLSKLEKSDIDKSVGNFEDAIFTDQPTITIDGDVVFENGFEVERLSTPKLTEISSQEVYDEKLLVKLSELKTRLEEVEGKLRGFEAILKKSLKIDGNQNISSRLEFQDALFNCESNNCHFPNIFASVLNGEDVSDWSQQLVFLDNDQFINGTLHATQLNATDIHVHGLVDGQLSQNLVTKSLDGVITGHKTFEKLITAQDVKVVNKLDGVPISSNTVLLTTGLQTVHGNVSFESIDSAWLKVLYLNGRNFSQFFRDLVFRDQSYLITGSKTFNDVAINELLMNPGAKINEVDLLDLWKNVMWKDHHHIITAPMTFSDVMVETNLNVPHGINGIQIPGIRIVDTTEAAVFTAPQVFTKSTRMSNLAVLDYLNGIPLVRSPDGTKQLDLLLKTGDQLVSGVKTFHTIHLDADSAVDGKVDKVDLSDFKALVLHKDSSIVSNDTWIFQNLVVAGQVSVKNKINQEIDLKDLYDRALKLNDTEIPEMIFSDKVTVEDLWSDNINNINVKTDLVLKNEPQDISGLKTFEQIVMEEETVIGLVNGRNLSFLNDILLRLGNQKLPSKVLKKNVVMKDVIVTGSINNVPVSDIVTLTGGRLLGSRNLKNVSFARIEAKNVELTGTVNGINLQEMIDNTVTHEGSRTITGAKEVNGTIYVLNGSNLMTQDLNGVNIDELWGDAVFLDIPQQVSGLKVFTAPVSFTDLSFDATFDGVSDWDMRHNWLLQNSTQTIEGRVTFQNGFSANNLLVGELNGYDLERLESDIVKLNEETVIEGPVLFDKQVILNGDLNVSGKIQGIDLSEEIVPKDKIVITGAKRFKDLVIGDLTVDGKVDGIFIEKLCQNIGLANNFSRLVIKGDVTLIEGGIVEGHLAGVDWKALKEIAVANDGSPINFSGKKKFSNVTFEGPVTIKGKIGGVDVDVLSKNYMSLTKPQKIDYEMDFDRLTVEGILTVNNLDTFNGEINGVNLRNLNERILKTSGVQNITANYHIDEVIFESDVFVAGKVNNLKLPTGLMLHNRTNYIQSPKIFEKVLFVLEDLDIEVGGTIQGVDVSDWYDKTVFKSGTFEIRGTKTFKDLDLIDGTVDGLLDGLVISEDNLLMTYGAQFVSAHKLIGGNVSIEGSLTVEGLINNVNLTELSQGTLQRDVDSQLITGLKQFAKPLTIVSLQAPMLTGVDLIELETKMNFSPSFDHLEDHLAEIEEVASHMQLAFQDQAVVFQYYELFDEFSISTAYNWLYVSGKDCGEMLLLSDNSSSVPQCSSIRIFAYQDRMNSFNPSRQELLTANVVSVRTLSFRGTTHLYVTNHNPHAACSNADHVGKETTDIYVWSHDSFRKTGSFLVSVPVDTVVFTDDSIACLVVLESKGSTVHCSSDGENFDFKEVLSTPGARKASVTKAFGSIFLAIAADSSSQRQDYLEGQKRIDVYQWNSQTSQFSSPMQQIPSTYVQSIQLMSHTSQSSEILFLALAEGSIPRINNEPRIIIYRFEGFEKSFKKYQEIKDYGTLEWVTLKTGELLLFVLDSRLGQIKIYQFKGASGFVKIDAFRSPGSTSLHAFVRTKPEDWLNHYLAVAGQSALIAQPQGVQILKSKVKGKRVI